MSVNRELMGLFRDSGRFGLVREIENFVFLAGPICHLTFFCSPTQRALRGHTRIDFEYGLTVIRSGYENKTSELEEKLRIGKYVALPKTIPSKHSLDMIVSEKGVSPWLLSEMSGLMERYCLSSSEALDLINGADDKLIENLRSVYGQKFDRLILKPLLDIECD